jgi:hypothetical protein
MRRRRAAPDEDRPTKKCKWKGEECQGVADRIACYRNNLSPATMSTDPTSSSIPVMRAPADTMSKGPNGANLAASARRTHPVDRMQRVSGSSNPLDLDAIRRLYGSALAMRLATERRLASQVGGRLPGMDAAPDSHAMLDTLTGDDLTIDFGDVLNLSENRPEDTLRRAAGGPVVEAGPHGAMETKLGL